MNRTQERVKELEETLDQVSMENADHAVHQHELFCKLESAEKTCVRTIVDLIKKLLMAMESPSHLFATIPFVIETTFSFEMNISLSFFLEETFRLLLRGHLNMT